MTLIYGTTNPAKLAAMRQTTADLPIAIIGLSDVLADIPAVIESGSDPLENAAIKAKAYYKCLNRPVFSCDSGLYFDHLDDDLQPGVNIRRIDGKSRSDAELITYYASLAKRHGGKLTGRYRNAIYVQWDDHTHDCSMDISLASDPFYIVDTPHSKRERGFPLDALSIEIESGQYYYDIQRNRHRNYPGFARFFEGVIARYAQFI